MRGANRFGAFMCGFDLTFTFDAGLFDALLCGACGVRCALLLFDDDALELFFLIEEIRDV
ncbi:MAG: hypothetical protein NVSMB56_00920 [Pyrinomonadaceae bacterium]